MIIITSLSPGHTNKENQTAALNSWKEYATCYSMNSVPEIEVLKDQYDINFVDTEKTMQHIMGRPLVSINAMIDFAIEKNNDLLLINSDIIISDLPDFNPDGITIFQRYDYTKQYSDAELNKELGFDVFYIPEIFLRLYPPSIFAMGAPWWDYWLPYRTMLTGVPVYYAHGKHAYHKKHNMQYDYKEWTYIGEFFKLEFQFDKRLTIPQVAMQMKGRIKQNIK